MHINHNWWARDTDFIINGIYVNTCVLNWSSEMSILQEREYYDECYPNYHATRNTKTHVNIKKIKGTYTPNLVMENNIETTERNSWWLARLYCIICQFSTGCASYSYDHGRLNMNPIHGETAFILKRKPAGSQKDAKTHIAGLTYFL